MSNALIISRVWRAVWLGMCVTLMLTGCVMDPPSPLLQQQLPRVSVVAVSQPGFVVNGGETVAWGSEILWIGDDSQQQYRNALTSLGIKQEIEAQFTQQGLPFVAPDKAGYTVVAAVVIGDAVNGAAVQELARLYPSLGPVSQTLEKGTLLLGLSHPGSPVILWRGAVQTFISGDVPPEQRKMLLQSVVRSLLITLPKQA